MCLDSIVFQCKENNLYNQVEIVIADNASTDNTQAVVEEYKKKYPNIVYFRNETNLGFDRSFVKLIEKSTGKYCLSIGDDDAFFDKTIPYILKTLETTTVPFFGLNCWGYDYALKEKVLNKPNLDIKNDESYGTLREYILTIKKYTNLVGIFVGLSTQLFLRDPWVAYKNKEQFYDTLAIHMYINLSVFKNSPFTILAHPVIKTRSSNIRWDVFAGLETISGRIKETIKTALWVKNTFDLPISKNKLIVYFNVREYWFTLKEIIKRVLSKYGFSSLIKLYRTIRSKF
jgi:abequosyltransferase